jgi:hypothetical protein
MGSYNSEIINPFGPDVKESSIPTSNRRSFKYYSRRYTAYAVATVVFTGIL